MTIIMLLRKLVCDMEQLLIVHFPNVKFCTECARDHPPE